MNPYESRKHYETPDAKRRASMDQAGTSPTNKMGTSPTSKFGFNFGNAGNTNAIEHQASLQQLYHERRMSGGSATAKKEYTYVSSA